MKRSVIVIVAALVLGMAGAAQAGYFEGFEGSGPFDFYADPGSLSGVTTAQAYGGTQSAEFSLDAAPFAYTRFKSVDISSYGYTLNDIQASDWVKRTLGRTDLSPYLLFTVATPNTPLGSETMVIQFSMAAISDNVWTENAIDRNTTTFHVSGNGAFDRTGLTPGTFSSSGTQGTLDALSAITYSGSTTWGDMPVTAVRVGVGQWDASQAYTAYVDNLNVTPEPATLSFLALGGVAALVRRRKGKK
jgi:hypothetical protein